MFGPPTEEEMVVTHPHLGISFWVQIDNIYIARFSECSAITLETEVFEYAEGGLNTQTHKLPVRTKYGNITLKRGMDPGRDLHTWYVTTMDGNTQRRNLSIQVIGPDGKRVLRWDVREAYPVKWTGPDLKSDAAAVAVETLEFAHNGVLMVKD